MYRSLALSSLTLLSAVRAQQPGTSTTETHPKINWKTCTGTGGNSCTSKSAPIVLDSNWRWTHTVSGYTNCYTGNEWDKTLCPNNAACTTNCAIEGSDYSGKPFDGATYVPVLTRIRNLRYHYLRQPTQPQVHHEGTILYQHWISHIPHAGYEQLSDVQPHRQRIYV